MSNENMNEEIKEMEGTDNKDLTEESNNTGKAKEKGLLRRTVDAAIGIIKAPFEFVSGIVEKHPKTTAAVTGVIGLAAGHFGPKLIKPLFGKKRYTNPIPIETDFVPTNDDLDTGVSDVAQEVNED